MTQDERKEYFFWLYLSAVRNYDYTYTLEPEIYNG